MVNFLLYHEIRHKQKLWGRVMISQKIWFCSFALTSHTPLLNRGKHPQANRKSIFQLVHAPLLPFVPPQQTSVECYNRVLHKNGEKMFAQLVRTCGSQLILYSGNIFLHLRWLGANGGERGDVFSGAAHMLTLFTALWVCLYGRS